MKILLSLFLLLIMSAHASDVSGFLQLKGEAKKVRVGEAYDYELVLVPADSSLFKVEDFENKFFLDLFYISEVKSISPSLNNADALVVEMTATLAKEAQFNNVNIWAFKESNIPIEVRLPDIEKTDLVQQQFAILNRDFEFKRNWPWWYYLLAICALFFGSFLIYKIVMRDMGGKRKVDEVNEYLLLLEGASTHRDLEILYEKRRVLLDAKSHSSITLTNLFKEYRDKQFTPDWRSQKIDHLLSMAKKAAREVRDGV